MSVPDAPSLDDGALDDDEGEGDGLDDPAAARPVVQQIVFEGNLLYGTQMIKARLRTEEGKRLDPADLDADMKELYRYFSRIQVVRDQVAGGIILKFRVSEDPLVARRFRETARGFTGKRSSKQTYFTFTTFTRPPT